MPYLQDIMHPIGKIGYAGFSAYSASKAGVITFTKSLAKELASSNIRVNSICPGPIDTNMMKTVEGKVKISCFFTKQKFVSKQSLII